MLSSSQSEESECKNGFKFDKWSLEKTTYHFGDLNHLMQDKAQKWMQISFYVSNNLSN